MYSYLSKQYNFSIEKLLKCWYIIIVYRQGRRGFLMYKLTCVFGLDNQH